MSKFINELSEQILDQYRPTRLYKKAIPAIECSIDYETDHLRRQTRIQHVVKWQHISWLTEDKDKEPQIRLHKNIMKQLINDVYGDFRTLLLQLEHALYEEDVDRAMVLTRELFKETGESL